MQTIIPPFSPQFHNRVYREYIRQRYNKYRHQHLRRPQAVILQKIIDQWSTLNEASRRKLFETHSQRDQTCCDSPDEGQSEPKRQIINRKKQRKKTTAFKKKKVKQEQICEHQAKQNQTQHNIQKTEPIGCIVLPKQQQVISEPMKIQSKSLLQQIPQIIQSHNTQLKEQNIQMCINTSLQSFNQSLVLPLFDNGPQIGPNQSLPQQTQSAQKMAPQSPKNSQKKTDQQQRWQRQIDQNSIKRLLSLTVSFQDIPSVQIKPKKLAKESQYLSFYKQKYSEIKEFFPQLTAIETTKVIKDLWKQQKQQANRIRKANKKQLKTKLSDQQDKSSSKSKSSKKLVSSTHKHQQNISDIIIQMQDFLSERPDDFPEDIWHQLKKDPLKFINVGRKIIA